MAGQIWEYGVGVLKVLAYIALFALCLEYEEPQYFIKGYFFADLATHVINTIYNWRKLVGKTIVELLLYLGTAVWILSEGPILPEHFGMMALAFLSFGTVKIILTSYFKNRERAGFWVPLD